MPSMCDRFSLPGMRFTLVRSGVRDRPVNPELPLPALRADDVELVYTE